MPRQRHLRGQRRHALRLRAVRQRQGLVRARAPAGLGGSERRVRRDGPGGARQARIARVVRAARPQEAKIGAPIDVAAEPVQRQRAHRARHVAMAREAARPEGGREALRRRDQEGVGTVAIRRGHHHAARPFRRRRDQRRDLVLRRQGHIAGHVEHGGETLLRHMGRSPAQRRVQPRRRGLRDRLGAMGARQGQDLRVGGDDEAPGDAGHPRQRRQHVRQHGSGQLRARRVRKHRRQPPLGRRQRLHGHDGGDHTAPSAGVAPAFSRAQNASTALASSILSASLSITVCSTATGRPRREACSASCRSMTKPSISPS